jgi:hypothetical protein
VTLLSLTTHQGIYRSRFGPRVLLRAGDSAHAGRSRGCEKVGGRYQGPTTLSHIRICYSTSNRIIRGEVAYRCPHEKQISKLHVKFRVGPSAFRSAAPKHPKNVTPAYMTTGCRATSAQGKRKPSDVCQKELRTHAPAASSNAIFLGGPRLSFYIRPRSIICALLLSLPTGLL